MRVLSVVACFVAGLVVDHGRVEITAYDKTKTWSTVKEMEARGLGPEELLNQIPNGERGAEWIVNNVPIARSLSPWVIVGSIGDGMLEGLGMKYFLEGIGVKTCKDVNARGDNAFVTQGMTTWLKDVLSAGDGDMTMISYVGSPNSFVSLVKEQIKQAYKTRKCIGGVKKGQMWAVKSSREALLLPAIGAAFGTKPKVILVTRDPRDTCTSKNQDSFKEFCPAVLGKETCVPRGDCYSYWAKLHLNILEKYQKKTTVCFVRIEDLVGDPTHEDSHSLGILKRVADSLNLTVSYNDAIHVLNEMHKFSSSALTGFSQLYDPNNEAQRAKLERETSLHGDPSLRAAMKQLGYSATKLGKLQVPKTKMMC